MKRIVLLGVLLGLALASYGQKIGLPYDQEYIPLPDSVIFVGKGADFQSLAEAFAACPAGGTIKVWSGVYPVDAEISNSKALTIIGDGRTLGEVQINPSVTMLNTSGNLKFENLSITTTFQDSALETSSSATLKFTDCDLNLRWVSFYDSVWFDGCDLNPASKDSFIVKGFVDMADCDQSGKEIQFNRGAKGKVIFCDFRTTSGDNVNIEGVLASPFDLEFISNTFRATADQCLVASGVGTLKLINNQFVNSDTLKYTVQLSDSIELTLIGNQCDNLFKRSTADQRVNSLSVLNADTMVFADNHGYGHCLIDTSAEADAADPKVRWAGQNSFTSMALFDGVSGVEIPDWVIGMGNDSEFQFHELFAFDPDSGGRNTCQADSGVVLHLMNRAGMTSGYLSTWGRLDLRGSAGFLRLNQQSMVNALYVGQLSFTGTDALDTVLVAGATSADKIFYCPNNVGAAPAANDIIVNCWGGANGDTVFVRRANSGTSGLPYALLIIKATN